MIMNVCLRNSGANKLDWQDQDKNKTRNQRKDQFSEIVEHVINDFILGTEAAPGQFKLNFEKDH